MLVSKSDNLNALCNEWADAFNKKYKLKIYLDRVYKSASKNIVPIFFRAWVSLGWTRAQKIV